jgi:hypothetical protein
MKGIPIKEMEGSSPSSQEPAIHFCPETVESSLMNPVKNKFLSETDGQSVGQEILAI